METPNRWAPHRKRLAEKKKVTGAGAGSIRRPPVLVMMPCHGTHDQADIPTHVWSPRGARGASCHRLYTCRDTSGLGARTGAWSRPGPPCRAPRRSRGGRRWRINKTTTLLLSFRPSLSAFVGTHAARRAADRR